MLEYTQKKTQEKLNNSRSRNYWQAPGNILNFSALQCSPLSARIIQLLGFDLPWLTRTTWKCLLLQPRNLTVIILRHFNHPFSTGLTWCSPARPNTPVLPQQLMVTASPGRPGMCAKESWIIAHPSKEHYPKVPGGRNNQPDILLPSSAMRAGH